MTVERGRAWGSAKPLPTDGAVAHSDAEVITAIASARAEGLSLPPVGVVGGDLWRTVGGIGDERRLRGHDAMTLPIDLAEVDLDGVVHLFVAHVVARRPWWRGRVWIAMNAEWLEDWDVAPRAHPGDGLLDVFDASLGFRDRMKARRRLRTGTHLPHPDITQVRAASARTEFDKPIGVWVDGRRTRDATSIAVRVTGELVDIVV